MKRLHALDTLRGVAALSIVIWHWQHFYAIGGTWPEGWQRSAQPFYEFLRPLYDEGWAAVDLFFALSGFVFFWLYAPLIRAGTIGPGKFAWLRFSRLYPLHLVTLLSVAVLQYFFRRATGNFFVYDSNDLQHFATGLFLAQQWLPPTLAQSFNGPAWSVSVEVLLYGVFFILCRLGLKGPRLALLASICGISLLVWNEFIARGVMGFFLGGAVFFWTRAIAGRADGKRIAERICLLAVLAWLLVLLETYLAPLHMLASALASRASGDVERVYVGEGGDLFLLLFIYVVSPLTLMALALHEMVLGGKWEHYSVLGDISYSTYMLHFPLQLALALAAAHLSLTPAFFENPIALGLFYAVLAGLGWISFNVFERPLQARLRSFPRGNGSFAAPGRQD
ncbi:MAG TPA: acyltransferase [Rhizomicrobium sp.]|jgi:peptidoglycan/LPS O-acetylase OafA/YrhL|nr:acyltransferase [Rhizomicrobium sp.]